MLATLYGFTRTAASTLLLLLFLTGGVLHAQISRVGSWTTGLTHTAGAGSFRVLIFAAGYENPAGTDIGLTSVTYGGQALTRITGEGAGTSTRNRSELWYLNEAGLAAAVGNTFSVSWSSSPAQVMYAAATYANVNQAGPIEDHDSTFTNSTTNPITRTMSKSVNSMVIGNYVCGNTGGYAWSGGFSEGFDMSAGSTTNMSGGDELQISGGTVVVSASHASPDRQALAAVTLSPAIANQPPVLASIGPKSVNEGANLNFNISASDINGTIPTFTSTTLPSGASFTGNGNGTATFNWTPTYVQSGVYNVTFRASDGSLLDTEVVAITVNNFNPPPVLASIGPKSVNEGVNLNFNISATDLDGTIPTFTSSTLPSGASLTGNGNGTATFNWTPTFAQSGVHDVTFRATDGSLLDTEVVAITVNNVNLAPVLASIGPQSVNEGGPLTFALSASDPDGTFPAFTSSTLPSGATLTDHANGTATFDWTPTYSQSGSYPVTFRATDGGLLDTEIVTLSVSNVNLAPILATIGPQSGSELDHLNFDISANDADGTTPTFTSSAIPSGATFTDHGNGTATFDWTPGVAESGSYPVTFRVSDGSLEDSEVVTITISVVNQPPVLASIGPKSVNEGLTLNFDLVATDPDGALPAFNTSALPAGATLTDHGDATATFDWTPTFSQSSAYAVTFRATDGSLIDTEGVTITVNDVNLPPVLAGIGPKNVNEGLQLNFDLSATDPDGTTPGFTSTTLPSGATLTDHGNGTATFDWMPTFVQSGSYPVTFRATDGSLNDSENVTITVNDVSLAPVLAAIGNQLVDEVAQLTFVVSATDPDLTTPSLSTSSLPSGASFTDNGDGTGTFDWTPNYTQSGSYPVTFRAFDGALLDTELITITVQNVNRPPVLASIGPKFVNEGVQLTFAVTATDPDLTLPNFSTSLLPSGATFTDHGNGSATFDWTPAGGQDGAYPVTVVTSDGTLADSETITITVTNVNLPPVLQAIGSRFVTEGNVLAFSVSATDPDLTVPGLNTSTLPVGASFTDLGNGSGDFSWTPTFAQSGSYPVTFSASDGQLSDSEVVLLVVFDASNHAPVLAPIGAQSTPEGVQLTFGVAASDSDGTVPAFTTSTLPAGALLQDHGNGTATFTWTPTFSQAGVYNVTFRATDGTAKDTEIVPITVSNVNQAPVWSPSADTVIFESTVMNRVLVAVDPDGPAPLLLASPLPANASFVDSGNGHGLFTFAPGYVQAGLYPLSFLATDGSLSDTLAFVVAVSEAGGQPPYFDSLAPQTVAEGSTLSVRVRAHDPDSLPLMTLLASGLPAHATFVDSGSGVGGLVFSPDYVQAGVYTVHLIATDAGLPPMSTVHDLSITVTDVNQAPVLEPIGARYAVREKPFSIYLRAFDSTAPPGNVLIFTTFGLPAGASFVDSGNGRASMNWTPTAAQVGVHNVMFTVTDNALPALNDQELVTITVLAANHTPVLNYIGPKFVTEGQTLQFAISATDADLTIPTLSITNYPPTASLVDHHDGTGLFTYIPGFNEAGLRSVEFRAADNVSLDKEIVLIQVLEAGNQSPNVSVFGPVAIFERDTLTAIVRSNDPDSTDNPVTMVSALPPNASFVSNGDGTGTFTFVPWFTQAGSYNLTFASSDGSLTDSGTYSFTVQDAGNQPPFLHALGNQNLGVPDKTFREELRDSLFVAGSDYDSTVVRLRATGLPAGATFSDGNNNLGKLVWQPTFSQAGLYQIVVFAKDSQDTLMYDSQLVSLTVNNFFPAPVWNPAIVKNYVLSEGSNLNLNLTTIPIDTFPKFKVSHKPANSTLTPNANGTCSFNYQPSFFQAGIDSAVIIAYHPLDSTIKTPLVLKFTVTNVPQAPVWRPKNDTTVVENVNMILTATADDPDGTTPTLSAQNLPVGATFSTPFSGAGSATGRVTWTPGFTQQGVYHIRLLASDGTGVDTMIVNVTVTDAGNQMPNFTIAPVNAAIILPGTLSVHVRATDPDATIPTLSVSPLPRNATFVDSGNGGGRFLFVPDASQVDSVYVVDFIAFDGVLQRKVTVTYRIFDFIRGDFNRDAKITSADIIGLVNYIFKAGPAPVPPPAGDTDASGTTNASDIIYLVNFLFKGGPAPPP